MPPERPDKASGSSKRHRRSHSPNLTAPKETDDLGDWPEPETSRSRKHAREDSDSQVESPSKRRELGRGSEPPMCKKTSKPPKAKRKQLRKNINHRKAPRTSEHKKLKDSVQTLEHDMKDAKQNHHRTEQELKEEINTLKTQVFSHKQELKAAAERHKLELASGNKAHGDMKLELEASQMAHQATKQKLQNSEQKLEAAQQDLDCLKKNFTQNTAELKRVRKICDEKNEQLRNQPLTIETDHENPQSLTACESCQNKDAVLKAKDANMSAMQVQLDEAENNLKNVTHELDSARTINDTNGKWNERIVQKERRAKETLKNARKEHNKNISALNNTVESLQQQCKDLKKSLKSQEDGFNRTITGLQKEIQDSLPQSQRYNFKLSDEKVLQDFKNLESKIRQFVDRYALTVRDATEQDLKIMWPGWSPELRRFLSLPLPCSLVFEGYVWERLFARIFAPWSKVWDGQLGPVLETALSIAGDETANTEFGSELDVDYQHWRSNSSSFIGHLNAVKSHPNNFDSDVEAMVADLAGLCGHEVNDTIKAEVMDIFTYARHFEIQLRMLKAVYTFHMCKRGPDGEEHKYGFVFDDQAMTDRTPPTAARTHRELCQVDFIMSPGLHKRGSNDAEGYANEIWLVKMGVVCSAAKSTTKSEPSTSEPLLSFQPHEVLPSIEEENQGKDHGTASQCHTGFMARGIETETPVTDLTPMKNVEGPDAFDNHFPVPDPNPTSIIPAPKLQDAPQTQSSPATNMVTRSQASLKANIKLESNHSHSAVKSTVPGGKSSAIKAEDGKGPGLVADSDPVGDFFLD